MKLRAEQLSTHLKKPLLPAYLLSGSELLLVQESSVEILKTAKANGFLEHCIFQVDSQFNWEKFLIDTFTLSLFSAKGIVELRFLGQLPNAAASKALQLYFDRLPSHKMLLMVTEKLDASSLKTAWFKAFDQKGAVIQIWPMDKNQFSIWLAARAKQQGLNLDQQALILLTELVEGNLFAAVQMLNQLKLLMDDSLISRDKILEVVNDQAQFNIFDLIEALLLADLKRAYRILGVLKDEGIEPLFVLSMLIKEIRLLAGVLHQMGQGQTLEKVLQGIYLPPKKQVFFRRVLPKFSMQRCRMLIQKAINVDRVVKGAQRGDVWQALSEFCLGFK